MGDRTGTKIDLDEVERSARLTLASNQRGRAAEMDRADARVTLALIEYIRELDGALGVAIDKARMGRFFGSDGERLQAIREKGAVLP